MDTFSFVSLSLKVSYKKTKQLTNEDPGINLSRWPQLPMDFFAEGERHLFDKLQDFRSLGNSIGINFKTMAFNIIV